MLRLWLRITTHRSGSAVSLGRWLLATDCGCSVNLRTARQHHFSRYCSTTFHRRLNTSHRSTRRCWRELTVRRRRNRWCRGQIKASTRTKQVQRRVLWANRCGTNTSTSCSSLLTIGHRRNPSTSASGTNRSSNHLKVKTTNKTQATWRTSRAASVTTLAFSATTESFKKRSASTMREARPAVKSIAKKLKIESEKLFFLIFLLKILKIWCENYFSGAEMEMESYLI